MPATTARRGKATDWPTVLAKAARKAEARDREFRAPPALDCAHGYEVDRAGWDSRRVRGLHAYRRARFSEHHPPPKSLESAGKQGRPMLYERAERLLGTLFRQGFRRTGLRDLSESVENASRLPSGRRRAVWIKPTLGLRFANGRPLRYITAGVFSEARAFLSCSRSHAYRLLVQLRALGLVVPVGSVLVGVKRKAAGIKFSAATVWAVAHPYDYAMYLKLRGKELASAGLSLVSPQGDTSILGRDRSDLFCSDARVGDGGSGGKVQPPSGAAEHCPGAPPRSSANPQAAEDAEALAARLLWQRLAGEPDPEGFEARGPGSGGSGP